MDSRLLLYTESIALRISVPHTVSTSSVKSRAFRGSQLMALAGEGRRRRRRMPSTFNSSRPSECVVSKGILTSRYCWIPLCWLLLLRSSPPLLFPRLPSTVLNSEDNNILRSSNTNMCRKVNCDACGKATWAGCGMHIDSALAGYVPPNAFSWMLSSDR